MTKTIKITALVAAVLLLIGTFFKRSHWPGANIILTVDIAIGIILCILLIRSFAGKISTGFEQFNGIFASLALIIGLVTFVFKLLHWPGAAIMIMIADIALLLAGAFFLMDGLMERESPKLHLKILAGFFILFLGLVIFLV
jgi:hypothetical protein